MQDGTTYVRFEVRRDGDTDLRFEGVPLADVSSQTNQGPDQSRWTEIRIYRTKGGKYVVVVVGRTQWQGEHDRRAAYVCEGKKGVIDALFQDDPYAEGEGYLSHLAKEALDEAGIDHAEEVD